MRFGLKDWAPFVRRSLARRWRQTDRHDRACNLPPIHVGMRSAEGFSLRLRLAPIALGTEAGVPSAYAKADARSLESSTLT
jgi:hypothetical protein